jgi:hypothetical protein
MLFWVIYFEFTPCQNVANFLSFACGMRHSSPSIPPCQKLVMWELECFCCACANHMFSLMNCQEFFTTVTAKKWTLTYTIAIKYQSSWTPVAFLYRATCHYFSIIPNVKKKEKSASKKVKVKFGVVTVTCTLAGCFEWCKRIFCSLDGIIRRYHLTVSFDGNIRRYHLTVSSDGIIRRYHLTVLSDGIIYAKLCAVCSPKCFYS